MGDSSSETFRKWTIKQRAYMAWLAKSKYFRIPVTKEKYAEEVGITSRTLRNWQNKDGFQDEVTAIARKYLEEDLPEIYAAVSREAVKGNFQHAKLAFELTGELDPSSAARDLNINIKWAEHADD